MGGRSGQHRWGYLTDNGDCLEKTCGFQFGCDEDPRRRRKLTEVFAGDFEVVCWRKDEDVDEFGG